MKSPFIISIVFLFVINIGLSQTKGALTHDDYERSWLTVLPKNYSAKQSYPLVIALHGGGGTAKQLMNNTRRRFNKLATKEGFVVVYPQGVKKSWNDNSARDQNGFARKENIDDVGFIKKMIASLESNYNINSSEIFACGISNGGLMSQTLAMELPEKINAIGMVASNFGEDQIHEVKGVVPFSIIFIHGTDDPIFPYNEGYIEVFNKKRGNVMGIEKSIDYMCNLNGNSKNVVSIPIKNTNENDGCRSEKIIYPNDRNPAFKVELIKVENGGHTWPGAKEQRLIKRLVGKTTQDFDASDALWEFFKSTMN